MTHAQRLATILLGRDVNTWIDAQRADGRSWRDIAQLLDAATNGQVQVSHVAVMDWAKQQKGNR